MLVPELEERDAARFSGYGWDQFLGLDHVDKAFVVAYYRVKRWIDMHVNDASVREQKRRRRREESRRRKR